MWYLIDKEQHSRSFDNLDFLIATFLREDEKFIIEYINRCADPDVYIFDSITLPYVGSDIRLGELTVAYVKNTGKWDELVQQIANEIKESIFDYFEHIPQGDTEIAYIENYIITHD